MIARTLLVALLLAPTQEPDPRLLRLLDVLERRHREAVDPGDARAAAARLGFDRARILAFVRDAIAWEPYEGVLRDASGTLRAGSGNSLDRALLLQAMLEAGGERTRLVRGDLDEAGGRALRAAARPPGETPAADLKSLAADLGVEAAALESVVESRRREREALVAETLEAAGPEADRLGALLGAKGAGRPAAPPTRHYLLQAEEKGGWTDLDPSPVPLSPTGIVPVEAAELAALRRRLSIRLVLVRRRGEARETQPLLSTTFDVP
ncbi:MAG TPA: hypothetical protein VEJ18_02160, partial [Planctomycetota bacterium]|nr:hypothetical protein [Planctomycetota bacterium]